MAECHPSPHAIIFPYPYQGHITPAINLSISLASKGFTVTFVQTEFIHQTAHGDTIFADSGLDIRATAIDDGFPLDYDRDANLNEYWEHMMLHFPARVDDMVGNLIRESDDGVPFFLIVDSLYTWPHTVAKKHNLVCVSLWTEPATVFSIGYHLDILTQNGHFPFAGNGVDHINYIPGVQLISTTDLMSFIQHPDVVPVVVKIVTKAFEQLKNADFILCNTVEELEPECLLALNQKQPTYAIGPMNYFFTQTQSVQKSLWPETDCAHWLNSKPHGSVLYISFGSIVHIDKHDIMEIAHGLLLSQVNFIWVLRISDTSDDVFPVGFEATLSDRGLVVPWCNQNAVLSNPAVGGFLTHCGWNSIVESIWSGVPMLCYPFMVDQPTNRKLVVNDWKIGINLRDESCQLTKDEIARKIGILMRGEMCIELRQEVKKFSKILRCALDADGSSQRNYDRFLRDLKGRIYAKKESHN